MRDNYFVLPEAFIEAEMVVAENNAEVVVDGDKYSLSWKHGVVQLRREYSKAVVQAAAFIMLYNSGLDAADAIALARYHADR